MFDGYYYRGTNSLEWSKIEQNPDLLFEMANDYRDYSRWLAAKGIYFFYENFLQAKRFAYISEQKAKYDPSNKDLKNGIQSVIIRAKFKKNCKALVLFTPDGLNKLCVGHNEYLNNALDSLKKIRSDDKGYKDSLLSNITAFTGAQINDLDKTDAYMYNHYNNLLNEEINIESRVITNLCVTNEYDIVIAAVQEKVTFNEKIHQLVPKTIGTNSDNKFHGFGYHDHIEVCVLNPNIIIQLEKCESLNDHKYDPDFVRIATM